MIWESIFISKNATFQKEFIKWFTIKCQKKIRLENVIWLRAAYLFLSFYCVCIFIHFSGDINSNVILKAFKHFKLITLSQ